MRRPHGITKSCGIADSNNGYYNWFIMTTVSFKVSQKLKAKLEAAARDEGLAKSEYIRQTLEASLSKRRRKPGVSALDLVRDLIGSAKGLPRDLSTNPKYLEDLGA